MALPDAAGNVTCASCPKGTVCEEAGVVLAALPVAAGWWRATPRSSHVSRCKLEAACAGGDSTATQCREGHHGPWCDVCLEGYYVGGGSGLCAACDENQARAVTGSIR